MSPETASPDPNSEPVSLSPFEPFGIGGRRLCFVDPRDASRCIKVLRYDDQRTVRTRANLIPKRWRREYDNNAHEQKELLRLFRRIGEPARECLPKCHGVIPTDLGPGLVLDLIRDRSGPISRSLRELVSTGHEPKEFRPAFEDFSRFMLEHTVLTRAILDHNLAAQNLGEGTWKLYLIDGFGDPAWLPFSRLSKNLAQKKIRRRLDRFWPKLERLAAHPVTNELIKKSSWGQGFLNHRT